MKLPPPRPARRGQPLFALAAVMIVWVGARTALWASAPADGPVDPAPASVSGSAPVTPAAPQRPQPPRNDREGVPFKQAPGPLPAPSYAPPVENVPRPQFEAPRAVPPQIAAGHQMLLIAGLAAMPTPEPGLAAAQGQSASAIPPVPFLPATERPLRWSIDGWLLWRDGGNGYNLPGAGLPGASLTSGAYGSSQAGLILRYRLAPGSTLRPTLYLRATTGLYYPRGEEGAAGFALRPVPGVPVAAMAEARVSRTPGGTVVRPAVALVTELPPARLPLGLKGEVYAQAGWVGGKDHTPFIDGQARIDAPLAKAGKLDLRLGAGAWGGAQRGAKRLDVGPSATLDLPVGQGRTRLTADYRLRVAGDAAPGSGVAITFSAGF
ncbi:MAG TPA: hypothetical protein PK680_03725 [Novosphingobium sp.]|nr:hypothetical protein [Novosphingobium sp.]